MAQREIIVAELARLIGLAPEVKTVLRIFNPLDTLSSAQFPVVVVEENLPEVGFSWKTGGFADVSFQVSIICAVMDNVNISTGLTNLDVAVKKVLAANPTISGTCFNMKPEAEADRSGTLYAPYGLSVRPVTIEYQGSAANGY